MPKGLVRNSGITHYLDGVDSRDRLLRSPQVGQNFESFIIKENIKGLQAAGVTRWDYYYFRTRNGAEVNLVLQGRFGVLPIEIKLGRQTGLKQLSGLQQFIARHALPFGILVTNSDRGRMLSDTIVQIPAGCL